MNMPVWAPRMNSPSKAEETAARVAIAANDFIVVIGLIVSILLIIISVAVDAHLSGVDGQKDPKSVE